MMDSWFSWLDKSIGTFAKKVLSALGIGWVSFEGITELAGQVKDAIVNSWGGIPGDILMIFSMAGFGVALGVILGALMYRASLAVFSSLGRLVS